MFRPRLLLSTIVVSLAAACSSSGGDDPVIIIPPNPPPPPTLMMVDPPTGPQVGGTTISLTGTNFVAPASVTLDVIPATDVVVVDETTILCITPQGAAPGPVDVTITTAGGSATLTAAFAYDDPVTIFNGVYFLNAIEYSVNATSGRTTWSLWDSGGAGTFSATWTQNQDGTVQSFTNPNNTYTVGADGSLTVGFPPSVGPFYTGGINNAGTAGVMAQTRDASPPYVAMALRRSGTFTAGSLNGSFHFATYFHALADPTKGNAVWGQIDFDGVSAISSMTDANRNFDGTAGLVPPVGGTYAVAVDGTLTAMTTINNSALQGGILEGSNVFFITGSTAGGGDLEAMIGLPVSAGLDTSVVVGEYFVAAISDKPGGTATQVFSGMATADGVGSFAFDTTINVEGTINPDSGSATYSVASDGTLSVDGGALMGAVTADGRFGFISGTTVSGEDPLLILLIRR